MAVQGAFNAVLGKKAGSFEASFIVHLIGTLLLGGLNALGLGREVAKRLLRLVEFLGGLSVF